MNIKFLARKATIDEYNNLTKAVGWGIRDDSVVEEALSHTLYSICVYDDDKLIVVPDGKDYTDDQIDALTEFQEAYFEHIIIR